MRVLYLSGIHPVLEYDECLLLEELDFDWFSTGLFLDPSKPFDFSHYNLRKPINRRPDEELMEEFLALNPGYLEKFSVRESVNTELSKSFIDKFDVIFSSQAGAIIRNWQYLKHKPIIFRTPGAFNPEFEVKLKPLYDEGKIFPVRISPVEMLNPVSLGGDVIRHYVDEDIYGNWIGNEQSVLSFQNWFVMRKPLSVNQNYIKLREKSKYHFELYGAYQGNKDPLSNGKISWDEQIRKYRNSRVYFYIGSDVPSVSYNFMEAMMAGCPVVTFGTQVAGLPNPLNGQLTEEMTVFIENGVNGFYSDDINELDKQIDLLMGDESLAREISVESRKTALKYFSKVVAIKAWQEFFDRRIYEVC